MNYTILNYSLYLVISLAMTIWVARTLHKNGRLFLVDTFHGRADLADSVNHLLVVGFYLINLGFVSVFLRQGQRPRDLEALFEVLSTKVGVVMLVLGGMHFFNLFVFQRMRANRAVVFDPPPVPGRQEVNRATR